MEYVKERFNVPLLLSSPFSLSHLTISFFSPPQLKKAPTPEMLEYLLSLPPDSGRPQFDEDEGNSARLLFVFAMLSLLIFPSFHSSFLSFSLNFFGLYPLCGLFSPLLS